MCRDGKKDIFRQADVLIAVIKYCRRSLYSLDMIIRYEEHEFQKCPFGLQVKAPIHSNKRDSHVNVTTYIHLID